MENIYLIVVIISFYILTGIETLITTKKNKIFYRISDTLVNLLFGTLSLATNVVVAPIYFLIYTIPYEHYKLFDFSTNNIPVFFIAFVYYDFISYVIHVLDHKVNWFWAGHVVHHQAETYNLSIAQRVTVITGYYEWLYFLPLALIGIPPTTILVISFIQILYQFFVHTELVNNLGWFEKILATPNHHKVHHASNDIYIDKNFGGIFIIWDKLFGTFQKELPNEPIRFGIKCPVKSLNPFYINFYYFANIAKLVRKSKSIKDKLSHIFMSPGFFYKNGVSLVESNDKSSYSHSISNSQILYCLCSFAVFVFLSILYISTGKSLTLCSSLCALLYFWITATILGKLLEGNTSVIKLEIIRLVALLLLLPILSHYNAYNINQNMYYYLIFAVMHFSLLILTFVFLKKKAVS